MDLLFRRQAVDATLARFRDSAFQWGKNDCVRMAIFHVRKMGHTVKLAKSGSYSTPAGALRALKAAGYNSLFAALSDRFEEIAPAMALPGDIIALPSDNESLPALAIRVSNNAVLHTFRGGFTVSQPVLFKGAWRVPCLTGGQNG